jgi:hypothetical protein
LRKLVGIVVLLLVLAAVGWTAAWFGLASVVRGNVEALAAADGVTNPRVTCASLDIGGYPVRFDVACVDAQVTSGDLTAAVPALRASIVAPAITSVSGEVTGPVELADAFTGMRNQLTWSTLDFSGRLDGLRLGELALRGRDIMWTDQLLGETTIAMVQQADMTLFDVPEQHDGGRGTATLAGYVQAVDLIAPALMLDDTHAEMELELTGVPDDVRRWDETLLQRMAAAGSRLRLISVHGNDPQSELDAQGEVMLTEAGLLEGQINIASTGVAERVGTMLAEPWRTLVLGVPDADGSHQNQLNFRGGAVFSGLVPIGQVPPLL